MNIIQILGLKSLRKAYQIIFDFERDKKPDCIQDADLASQIIFDALTSDKPCMIGRFGSTELECLMNYVGVTKEKNKFIPYFQGKTSAWWWEQKIIDQMQNWSGFFPPTQDKIEQFCQLMLNDIPQVDILGSWLIGENIVENHLKKAHKVHFRLLEPFWSNIPWTRALRGKKVLVVHPFAETILNQYDNRLKLFNNSDILPEFKCFNVIQAVQTLGDEDERFIDWFEALEYMKSEIDKEDYDVCLIGCGAYGFHLAAHVKRSGKKAVHLGGSLQLLFGIKGKRWESPIYGIKDDFVQNKNYLWLFNDYWVYPDKKYRPKNYENVEGGTYW